MRARAQPARARASPRGRSGTLRRRFRRSVMRIITLNVNGIRSAERRGLARWLARAEPWDVVCLQEIKADHDDVPRTLRAPRRAYAAFHPARAQGLRGVALYARAAGAVATGFGERRVRRRGPLPRGRLRRRSSVISVYLPSGSSGPHRQASKFRFLEAFLPHLATLRRRGARSSCAATGTSRTSRSTSRTGAATRRTRASCPRSARGSRACSTSWASSTCSAASTRARSSTRGGRTAARRGRRTSAGASTTRSPRPGIAAQARAASIYTNRRFSDHAPLIIDYDFELMTGTADADAPHLDHRHARPRREAPARGASLTVHAGHKVGLVGAERLRQVEPVRAAARRARTRTPATSTLPPRVDDRARRAGNPGRRGAGDRLRARRRRASCARSSARSRRRRPRTTPTRSRRARRSRDLHHRFEAIGGYAARARAATLLAGLGFADARHARPGGELLRRLAHAPEPRAGADVPAPTCCCSTSRPTTSTSTRCCGSRTGSARYPGTLLLITHDRDFLDGVVDGIVHFDGPQAEDATPATTRSSSASARAQLALQQATYAKQQRQIAHLQAFVDRFRAKATKAKQAQSRIKALERMERDRRRARRQPVRVRVRAGATSRRRQLVRLEHATLGYGDAPPVLERLDWSLLAGDRIGLLGPNGAGKSTLLKAIAGTLPLAAGQRLAAQGLRSATSRSTRSSSCAPTSRRCWHLARIDPARARAGAARLPRRLRFPRRHGDRGRRRTSPAARRRGSRSR